jgi:hypothetical protein
MAMDEGVIDRLRATGGLVGYATATDGGGAGGNGGGAAAHDHAQVAADQGAMSDARTVTDATAATESAATIAVSSGAKGQVVGSDAQAATTATGVVASADVRQSAGDEGAIDEGERADPYLKSMLLSLIEESYLHSGTFTQFAAEVLKVLAYAVTVPVAFTEGFLRAYLSIERIEETDEGQIKIIPKADASEEDWIRDVDEITAQVDPSAVFNPIVRSKLEAVHDASSKVMKYDMDQLSRMTDGQLMDVLRQMQRESEEFDDEGSDQGAAESDATKYVRAKLATIRRNVRQFQAQARRAEEAVERGLGEFGGEDG